MHRFFTPALVAILAAAPALAQRGREIPLPDTLGANFNVADSATKADARDDLDRGEFALGLTWSDESNRYAIQRYGSDLVRIRYFAIEPDHFFWWADRSSDGGKTWLRDSWAMEAKRIGR